MWPGVQCAITQLRQNLCMTLLKHVTTCLMCVLLLSSCASSLAYNRLDWLIPWYVGAYVDLSSEQRQSLRDQLVPLLQWHRQEELARYQELLHQIEVEMENPLTASQVRNWIEELSQAAIRIEKSMLNVSLEFGASISNAQMDEFIDSLNEQQEEFEEEFLSRTDEEYVKENTAHVQKLMERLLGRLQTDQKERLRQSVQEMQRFDDAWLKDRRLWLEQLEPLLAREAGWQESILQAYADREPMRPAEYQRIVDHNTQLVAAAVADVLNSRTPKQSAHAKSEFEDMRVLLQQLMDAPKELGSE